MMYCTQDDLPEFDAFNAGMEAHLEQQGCAEGRPFPRALMNGLLDLAEQGVAELIAKQREVLGLA